MYIQKSSMSQKQRFRKIINNSHQGIKRTQTKRISMAAGVLRISSPVYEEVIFILGKDLLDLIRNSIYIAKSQKRKTIYENDVRLALARDGIYPLLPVDTNKPQKQLACKVKDVKKPKEDAEKSKRKRKPRAHTLTTIRKAQKFVENALCARTSRASEQRSAFHSNGKCSLSLRSNFHGR